MSKINLDESFGSVWKGYIPRNGDKVYLFGKKDVRVYHSRTSELLSERSLSWDSKSYCNKAYCMKKDDEYVSFVIHYYVCSFSFQL
jgi:hypothetical protein